MNYYEEIIKIITSKDKFLINLGLERISKVMELFGNPQNKIKTIHVAGTNGKGSTSAIIAKILEKSGFKVGLYTSPHVLKYNERIKINGVEITDKELLELLEEVLKICEENDLQLSEFELLTAVAFLHFEQEKVDFLVLETGLGGRLDATNVVEKPLLSVITSISLEHTDRLGDTIEKIAFEKAGIIKENCPLVICAQNAGYKTISGIAKSKKSLIILPSSEIKIMPDVNKNTAIIDGKSYEFSLLGEFQAQNLGLAIETAKYLKQKGFDIDENAIKTGLKDLSHPSRFEYIKDSNLLIDGAHNPDGARVLRESLDLYFKTAKKCFIYSSLNTKDYKNFLKEVLRDDDELYLYDFKRENAVKTDEIKNVFKTAKTTDETSVLDLIETNLNENTLTIITGSLYAIGDLKTLILSNPNIAQSGSLLKSQ